MRKIKSIIIGLGNIGINYDFHKKEDYILTHAKALFLNKKFHLLAAFDTDKNQRKKFESKYKIKAFPKLSLFFNKFRKTKIDFVIISCQSQHHYQVFKELCLYTSPRVVLCEKPFCDSHDNACKFEKLAKKKNCRIFINYTRNTDKQFNKIKKKILKYNVAKVFFRGPLLINGSHFISLFLKLLGDYKFLEKKIKKKFIIYFQKGKVHFQETKNITRYYIKNKKFLIKLFINRLSIQNFSKKNKPIINEVDRKNNQRVIKEVEKYFRNRKTNLTNIQNALQTLKIIEEIKK